jgi:cystathionine beta-lyase/cystathionine gamma-synthase
MTLPEGRGLATRVIHAGEGEAHDPTPLTTPIYQTSTFVFRSAAELDAYNAGRVRGYLYSRYENPTVVAVEAKLAALEGAEAALAFSSGMGAVATTAMALLKAGDEVVCPASLYGGTVHLFADLLGNFGVTSRFASFDELRSPQGLIGERTRLFWFESPVNPMLRCVDIRAVADACHGRGVWSAMDNTFASPVNQQPIPLGVDLVMHSATKYLGGHSDITAGAIAGPKALIDRISKTRRLLGTVLDPQPAYDLGRSLKTLAVRVERQNATARAVAEFLEGDARVSRVFYPGLPSHPDHLLARQQMIGFGGMVCADLGGSFERACRAFDRLRIIKRAASLGGVESLCSLPILTSQAGYTDAQLARAEVTKGMLRLSIGLEDPADLIADLDQALEVDR